MLKKLMLGGFIIALTAGTVMLSLVGQGATMSILLRRLGVVGATGADRARD